MAGALRYFTRVFEDREHAIVTYRGRGVELEIPTAVTASWQ